MKFFVIADDPKHGEMTYVCKSAEIMREVWNELGDAVRLIQKSENFNRETIFERCW